MVFTRRSKGDGSEQLLSVRKSERSESVPRVLKNKKLTGRIKGIFKKSNELRKPEPWNDVDDIDDTETAPPTPEPEPRPEATQEPTQETTQEPTQEPTPEPTQESTPESTQGPTPDEKIDLQIFSNKPYAVPIEENERLPDDRSYGATTISDLSASINPMTSPSTLNNLYRGRSAHNYEEDGIVDGESATDFESKTTKQDDFETSCVVQGLLGLMDQTCGTTPEPECNTKDGDDSTFQKPRGQYTSIFSTDPTADDNTAFYDSSIGTNEEHEVRTRTSITSSPTVDKLGQPTHEDFELILDPKCLSSAPAPKPFIKSNANQVETKEALTTPNQKSSSTNTLGPVSSPTRASRTNPAQKLSPFVKRLTGRRKSNSNTTSTPERRRRLKLNRKTKKDEKSKTSQEENDRCSRLNIGMINEDELTGEEYIEENGTSTFVPSLSSPVEYVDQSGVEERKPSKDITSSSSWTASLNRVAPLSNMPPKNDEESVKTSPARLVSKSDTKFAWREVADPATGRPYYYHRLTRKTTWTKPANFAKATPQNQAPKESERATPEIKKNVDMKNSHVETYSDQLADSTKSEDEDTLTDSLVILSYSELSAETQKKIDEGKIENISKKPKSSILKETSTSPIERADKREEAEESQSDIDEEQLRSLNRVKSLPFDEPAETEVSLPDKPRNRSLNTAVTGKTEQSASSAKTGKTEISSNTGKTENTTKTERTELVKNVNEVDSRVNSESSENEPGQIPHVRKQKNTVSETVNGNQKAFERRRDLRVEEFTSSRFGLTTENYNDQASPSRLTARQRRLMGLKNKSPAQESEKGPVASINSNLKLNSQNSFESEDYYNGDNDETDYETLADTVSALSNPDIDFQNRLHNFDKARRQALDDAIKRKDWDLAASVIDHIRNRSFERGEPKYFFQEEWTQSEIDKFISENDWDAVASYIAFMRDNHDNVDVDLEEIDAPKDEGIPLDKAGTEEEKKKIPEIYSVPSKDASVQKRFGARSQLQHEDEVPSMSSWDSESYWESDEDYSSASSGDGRQTRSYRSQREKFAC